MQMSYCSFRSPYYSSSPTVFDNFQSVDPYLSQSATDFKYNKSIHTDLNKFDHCTTQISPYPTHMSSPIPHKPPDSSSINGFGCSPSELFTSSPSEFSDPQPRTYTFLKNFHKFPVELADLQAQFEKLQDITNQLAGIPKISTTPHDINRHFDSNENLDVALLKFKSGREHNLDNINCNVSSPSNSELENNDFDELGMNELLANEVFDVLPEQDDNSYDNAEMVIYDDYDDYKLIDVVQLPCELQKLDCYELEGEEVYATKVFEELSKSNIVADEVVFDDYDDDNHLAAQEVLNTKYDTASFFRDEGTSIPEIPPSPPDIPPLVYGVQEETNTIDTPPKCLEYLEGGVKLILLDINSVAIEFMSGNKSVGEAIHDYINNLRFRNSATPFFQDNNCVAEKLYALAGDVDTNGTVLLGQVQQDRLHDNSKWGMEDSERKRAYIDLITLWDPGIQERKSLLDSTLRMLFSYGWDAIFTMDGDANEHPWDPGIMAHFGFITNHFVCYAVKFISRKLNPSCKNCIDMFWSILADRSYVAASD